MTKEAIQEIALMQHKIDVYEMSLILLAGMCKNEKDTSILCYNDLPASPWIEVIYEFIKEHINEKKKLQDICNIIDNI